MVIFYEKNEEIKGQSHGCRDLFNLAVSTPKPHGKTVHKKAQDDDPPLTSRNEMVCGEYPRNLAHRGSWRRGS